MAIQSYSRALGNPPLPTTLEVNDETGEASLYAVNGYNGRTLIATSGSLSNEWDIKNQFRRRWNAENGLSLSQGEFEDEFHTNPDLKGTLNADRASLINTHSSDLLKKTLNEFGVSGVQDPTTGTTTDDTTDTPPTADDLNDQGEGADSSRTSSASNASGAGGDDFGIQSLEGAGMPSEAQLRYPSNMDDDMNKLQINIIEYNPRGVADSTGDSYEVPDRQKGRTLTSIFLPIPGGIQDQNQVSWNKGDMNALQQAAAEVASNFIEGGPDAAGNAANSIVNRLKNNTEATKKLAASAMAGQASGLGSGLLTRQTGAIINPNTELLFNGPSMRNFGFSFNMSARSFDEAKTITLIIRALKQGMSVRRSQSGLFLLSPNIFELKYLSGSNQPNPHLNKFKMCAMTSLNVNYTPNQTFMTFENNMPVAYQVDMQFSELDPIFNDDYTDDNSIGF